MLMEHIILKRPIRSVCVYCGSGRGLDPRFASAARSLGQVLAQSGLRLVYGGGGSGLMGDVARSALANGGRVTGIIPESLRTPLEPIANPSESPGAELGEMIVVRTLHERKMQMYEHSDAFIALPGGLGTLEEVIEQLTWAQLGHHTKPIILLNIGGYWDLLLDLMAKMRNETFLRPFLDPKLFVAEDVEGAAAILLAAASESGADKPETDGIAGLA
jgi:uncharacterized protein (TIGR00730 family)